MKIVPILKDDAAMQEVKRRKEVERDLRSSEEKFIKAILCVPDAISITTLKDGTFIDVNDAYEELSGFTRQEIIGRSVFDLSVWADPDERDKVIKNLKEKGRIRDMEFCFPHRSGEIRDCLSSAEIIQVETEPCLLTVTKDITERKQAQENLQKYEHIVSASADLLVFVDKDYIYQAVNDSYLNYFSKHREEVIGYSVSEVLGQDVFETRIKPNMDRCLSGQHLTYQIWIDYPTKGRRYMETHCAPFQESDGSISGVAVDIRDITEHQQAQEKLQRHNELSQALVKLQSEIISSEDPHSFFDNLLSILLSVTNSEYGFIGGIQYDEKGTPSLTIHAITYISWDDEIQKLFDEDAPAGLVFRKLDNVFGRVVTTGETVIANELKHDPRNGGLPSEYPALDAFLGLPLHHGNDFIGMVGLSDRPGGYDEIVVEELQPLLTTCANIIVDHHNIEKRREIEAQLKHAQRIARLGFWDWDIITNKLYWSDEIYRIFGYRPGKFKLSYDSFLETVHPDDRTLVEQKIYEALHNAAEYNLEHRIILPGDVIRFVYEQGEVEFDPAGKPVRMIGTVKDITEHKLAEIRLQISHNRLRDLMRRIEAAREEERTTIARDIHDELGQNLTGLKMDLSWLLEHLPKSWKKLPERIRSMIELVDTTVDYVRRLSSSLRPAMLDDLGLEAAIEWQLQGFKDRTNCQYTFDFSCKELNINKKRDTVIFRIFQEALTNIARHAQATHVAISLCQKDSQLVLTVADDGIGINEQNKMSGESLGLIGMQERADAGGGHVQIDTPEHGGTCVTLSMPFVIKAT
jgi:PAS domain S-box-containing protein